MCILLHTHTHGSSGAQSHRDTSDSMLQHGNSKIRVDDCCCAAVAGLKPRENNTMHARQSKSRPGAALA